MNNMESMNDIWAIVLAAGESARMGRPKMLLPFGDMTMIEHVISNIRKAGIENINVVIGAEKEKLSLLLEKLFVNFCINNNYREGMLSSVICGIRNLPENMGATLVFPGDQPFISPSTITRLVESYRSSSSGILIPVFKDRRGHPILIDHKFRQQIEMLDRNEGLRALSSLYPHEVSEVETGDPGILRDFDTYEEYIREINKIS